MAVHQTLAFSVGLLGNIISFITFLAPLPTFYQIYKKKSADGFQSIPYLVSLLSAMLLIYYGFLKNDILIITINAVGCFIETAYVVAYLLYASRNARIETMRLLGVMNCLGYGMVLAGTLFLVKADKRAEVLGWIGMVFSLCVFAAPLCIMRKVIKTKSVEFMPLPLSVFLTLGAVVWFFYGFFKQDYFIAVPNILGLVFGLVQMALYFMYRNAKKLVAEEPKLQELAEQIIDVVKLGAAVCPELSPVLKDIADTFTVEVNRIDTDSAEAAPLKEIEQVHNGSNNNSIKVEVQMLTT